MANKIQLTPSELKAQAAEMSSLQAEYEALFSNIDSDLKTANGNWSGAISGNFSGKITSARRSFSYLTTALEKGAVIAEKSAVTYESVDSALAKLSTDDPDFNSAVIMGRQITVRSILDESVNVTKENIKSLQDIFDYIDSKYDSLSGDQKLAADLLKLTLKNVIKDTSLDTLRKAYKITEKIIQGDFTGAADDFCGEIFKIFDSDNGSILWSGLKMQAVTKTIKLVTDSNGYIAENNQKYMDIATEYLKQGDVAGTIAAIGGDFVQTVGKGSVDVACQLTSGFVDSVTSKAFGISLSDFNDLLYDKFGTSPGHIFNGITKHISNGTDAIVDAGIKVTSAVGKAAGKAIKGVGSFIGGLYKRR